MKIFYSVLLCFILASTVALANAANSSDRSPITPLDDLSWGEACRDSIPLHFSELPFCTTATTAGARNDYSVPCIGGPFNTGPDVVYCLDYYGDSFVRTVTASLCGTGFDGALHVWRNRHPDAAGSTLIGCSNSACEDDGCVTFTMHPDSFYYIVVDGGQSWMNSGIYQLNIREGTICSENACDSNPFPGESRDIEPVNDERCGLDAPFIVCDDTLVGHVSSMSGPDTVDYYTFYIDPGFCYQPTIEVFGFPDGAGTFNPVIYTHRIDEGCSSWGLPEASVTGEDDVYLDLACLLPGLYQFGVASQGPGGYYMLLFKCTECACGTTSLPNFDLEQNNNLCGPNNPALASGDSLWGAITNLADVDWFNFEVTEQSGETVSVSLIADGHPGFFTYGQGLNPKLFLFGNQCQSMIANDDDSGLGADAFLGPIFLPQGFYSIKVEGNGSVGPYILGTRCESCPCETCPHPNRDNEANNGSCGLDNPVVSCGQTFCGEILNPNDLDYYTFIPPQDACTWFTIRVLADDTPDQCAFGGGLDAAIDVYSANCGGLLYSEDFGGVGTDPIATFSQEYPESAYTIVVRGTANSSGRYILEVNGQPAECLEVCIVEPLPGDLFEYEYCGMSSAGNGCEGEFFSAYSIQCGESYFGYSDANEAFIDQDWYQFTVHDSNDMVAVCLESSFDAALSVIAAGPASDFCWERDLLNCTIAPQCATTCDSLCLAPGDYFFEVKPLAPYFVTCGKYRLSMKCGDCQPSRPAPIEHLTVHFPDDEYVADPERTNVVLRWEEIQDADQYLVYRTTNTDPGAIISPENLIAVTDLNRYIDESRIQNDGSTEQVYYAVVVRFLTSAPPCDSGN